MVKSVLLNKDGTLIIQNIEEPQLEKGALILETIHSEVCGTDVHLQRGHLAGVPYPIIPGHVSVGKIKKINGEVLDVDGKLLRMGDIVTFLDVHETCNSCWYCLVAKETTRCPSRKVYGITYSADDGLLGGWSEQIYLKSGVKVLKLPETLAPKIFMAAGCGLPTAIHAIQRAEIQLGDTVVVQGSGPVGLLAVILARVSGAFKTILVGGPKVRLDICKEFGMDYLINIDGFNEEKRLNKVLQLTNMRGADIVIEATGVPSAVKEGLQMVRDGGKFVVVGQYTNAGDIAINPHLDINKKHITIKGSWGSDFSHFYLGLKFMNQFRDTYPWEKIISKEYTLENASQALDDVENYRIMKALISPNKNMII